MYSMCDHPECGLPSWSSVHFPTHPSNRGNKSAHAFFKLPEVGA